MCNKTEARTDKDTSFLNARVTGTWFQRILGHTVSQQIVHFIIVWKVSIAVFGKKDVAE